MNENNDIFYQAFKNSLDPAGIFDLDDNVLLVNKAFEDTFGYLQEELQGKSFPGQLGYDEGVFKSWVKQCRESGGVQNFFTRRKTKNGNEIIVSINITPIYNNNELASLFVNYRDITDLFVSRTKLTFENLLINNINDAVVSVDLSKNIISWNIAAENLYGYKENEVLGVNLDNLLRTDYCNESIDNINLLLKKTNRWRGTVKQYTIKNDVRYIDSQLSWLKNEDEQIVGLVCVNRDMTDKILNEEIMANLELEKSAILDHQTDAIVLQDIDNNILWANKAALEGTGNTLEEVRKLKCFDIWGDGGNSCYSCSVEMVKKSNKVELLERTSSNGTIWSIKASPIFDKEGNLFRILEVAENITKLRETDRIIAENEAKYRSLASNAPVGILVVDDLMPVFANPKAIELFGFDDFEELQSKEFYNYIHPDDYEFVSKTVEKLRNHEMKDEPFTINFRIMNPKKGLKYLTVTTSYFKVQNEGFYQSIILDNTELAELNAIQKNLAVESVYLNEKNKLIEELAKQFKLITEKYTIENDDRRKYEKILNTYFQPERDWIVSKKHFEAVHKDFFSKLKVKFPGLTQNELRHCAYIKMNYTTKEIARIFNVEATSIQKARLRLKKKLVLSKKDDLYMFIMTV